MVFKKKNESPKQSSINALRATKELLLEAMTEMEQSGEPGLEAKLKLNVEQMSVLIDVRVADLEGQEKGVRV